MADIPSDLPKKIREPPKFQVRQNKRNLKRGINQLNAKLQELRIQRQTSRAVAAQQRRQPPKDKDTGQFIFKQREQQKKKPPLPPDVEMQETTES